LRAAPWRRGNPGSRRVKPTRIESDSMPKEGKRQESSSFLKKRTKKLLIISLSAPKQESKTVARMSSCVMRESSRITMPRSKITK
jgi:hypothetical protein